MGQSLKQSNLLPLYSLILLNFAFYISVLDSGLIFNADWIGVLQSYENLFPAALALSITGLTNSITPVNVKAQIIFWKIRNALPGSAAFSMHMNNDDRIDPSVLKEKFGCLPEAPRDQNRLWYKLYTQVQNVPPIKQSHKEFLLARDYAVLSIYFFIAFFPLSLYQFESKIVSGIYGVILILQYFVSRYIAKNSGIRFVKNVLAVQSSDLEA